MNFRKEKKSLLPSRDIYRCRLLLSMCKEQAHHYVQQFKIQLNAIRPHDFARNVINYSTFINAQGRAQFQSFQFVECYPHADTTRTCLFTQDNRRTFLCIRKPCHRSKPRRNASQRTPVLCFSTLTPGKEREINWSTAECYSGAVLSMLGLARKGRLEVLRQAK